MNKLHIEIFDGEAELLSFEKGKTNKLEFIFAEPYDGFITAGGITARVCEGKCLFDLRLMDDGETSPVLILKNGRTPLPSIVKDKAGVSPSGVSAEFLRAVSLRERRLRARVKELEEKIEKLSRSVYGVTVI